MATAANASSDVRSLVPNDAVSREFWEAVQASELKVQKCDACGHLWFPPSDACPQCLSPSYTWAPVSGRATVYSWVVYHHRYHPAFEPPLGKYEWLGRTAFVGTLEAAPESKVPAVKIRFYRIN